MQFSMQTVLVVVFLSAFTSACPQGYGCYRSPKDCGVAPVDMCDQVITWKPNDANGIDFSVNYKSSDATKARWAAIGFSLDGKMGDDDILMCRQTTADINTVVLEHYWSIGETSIMKEEQDGLSNIVTSFEDGYLRCNFTRALSVAGKPHVYDLSETTTADMMPKYYFLAGSGMVNNEVPIQHEVNPFHTNAGVDFTAAEELIKGEGSSSEEGGGRASANIASVMVMAAVLCMALLFK